MREAPYHAGTTNARSGWHHVPHTAASALAHGASGFAREIAVKTLAPELVGDAELERALIREATLAGRLRHRNLVAVLGTMGGAAARQKLYDANHEQDRPGAFLEDFVAVGGGFLTGKYRASD